MVPVTGPTYELAGIPAPMTSLPWSAVVIEGSVTKKLLVAQVAAVSRRFVSTIPASERPVLPVAGSVRTSAGQLSVDMFGSAIVAENDAPTIGGFPAGGALNIERQVAESRHRDRSSRTGSDGIRRRRRWLLGQAIAVPDGVGRREREQEGGTWRRTRPLSAVCQSVPGIPLLSTDTGVPPATGTEPLGVNVTLPAWSNVQVETVTLPTETVRSVPGGDARSRGLDSRKC